MELEYQQSNVVHHAGNEQCGYGVEYADLGCPLYGVGLTGSGCQGTDAWHVETDGKDKRQTFSLGKVCGQDLRDTSCSSAGGFGSKGRADQTAAGAVQGIQYTQQRLLGDSRGTESEERFPFQTEEYRHRLDKNAYFVQDAALSTAAEAVGQDEEHNRHNAKDISKKIKSVKRDKQRKGQFIGGKPMYGYKMHPTEKNEIVIDEEVAPVVRRIFAMALDGMSCRKIAATLNEEGVPTPATYCGWNMGRKGPYAGLWSSERISEMLQNETYLGNMVQGRTVKISYKSKKCLKQDRENWVVVENTHEPLIDKETFQKVRMLVNSRKHTRSRTYDFLLKGLIFCHECGYPMAVLNRPPVSGEDRLFFVCRTYQRFTKAGVCSCHSIKEQVVTEAVLAKVREVCEAYLDPNKLQPIAADAVEKARKAENHEAEIQSIQNKIDSLTANLDKMYMDRLTGLLAEADFERIYQRVKMDRTSLEEKLKELESQKESPVSTEDRARELVQQFLDSAYTSRELLVSLIERVELTENKQIIIKFRFRELEAIS